MQATSANPNVNEEVENFLEGNYVKIESGESRTLEFSLDKESIVDTLDFNKNPIKKVQFSVTDPARRPNQTEKIFQLSRKHGYKVHRVKEWTQNTDNF